MGQWRRYTFATAPEIWGMAKGRHAMPSLKVRCHKLQATAWYSKWNLFLAWPSAIIHHWRHPRIKKTWGAMIMAVLQARRSTTKGTFTHIAFTKELLLHTSCKYHTFPGSGKPRNFTSNKARPSSDDVEQSHPGIRQPQLMQLQT